jgi:hypothetical protein
VKVLGDVRRSTMAGPSAPLFSDRCCPFQTGQVLGSDQEGLHCSG